MMNKIKNLFRKIGSNSDGYHTFDELYAHRIQLFIALCHAYPNFAWKSLYHWDGSQYGGWFIAGMFEEDGKQITYHLPMKNWLQLNVKEVQKAPKFDGHTAKDVLLRLQHNFPISLMLKRGGT